MIAYRVGSLIRYLSRFSLRSFVPFFSSSAASGPWYKNFLADNAEEGSAVYRHALKFQRPTTIIWQRRLVNSVSLIGVVDRPLQPYKTNTWNDYCIYTVLKIDDPLASSRKFTILLEMRDNIAKLCEERLRRDDFIYVSGQMTLYTKPDQNGDLRVNYKVIVTELNYVAKCGHGLFNQRSEKPKSELGQAGLEKYHDRDHLWQLYFANPHDWWDNRESKRHPGRPDFKHKDTGEALWLNPDDPLWVKRQLQLLDSKMAEQGPNGHMGRCSRLSTLVFDEFF